MIEGTEVIYTIRAINLDKSGITRAVEILAGLGCSTKIRVTPATESQPGQIDVPRLFTAWRGDEAEAEWQEQVRAIDGIAQPHPRTTITVEPWSPPS